MQKQNKNLAANGKTPDGSGKSNGNGKPVVVQTVFGSLELRGKKVPVRFGGEFLLVDTNKIPQGADILCPTSEMPRITLETADNALRECNSDYIWSQKTLFEPSNGVNHPIFQLALLQGINEKPEKWAALLDVHPSIAANFASGEQIALTCQQAETAASIIHAELGKNGVINPKTNSPVSTEHIRDGWLGGKVVAPLNYRVVAAALLDLAPGMSKLLTAEFGQAYHDYIGIRHKIVEKVNHLFFADAQKENGEQNHNGTKKNGNGRTIHLEEAATNIVNHLAFKQGDDFCVVHVVGVGNADIKSAAPPIAISEIPAERMDSEKLPMKSRKAIAREYIYFSAIASGILIRMVLDNNAVLVPKKYANDKKGQEALVSRIKYEVSAALAGKDAHLDAVRDRIKKLNEQFVSHIFYYKPGTDPDAAKEGESIRQKIQNGEFDAAYGLKPGTLLRVFRHEHLLRSSVPNDVFYAIELVNVQNKREEEHKRRYAGAKNPPAISFKVETREVEKLSRDPELVEQVRIINQPVFAFAQAKIFLREIGAGDVAEKSARLYEFAVSEEAKAAVRYMPAIRRGPGI